MDTPPESRRLIRKIGMEAVNLRSAFEAPAVLPFLSPERKKVSPVGVL